MTRETILETYMMNDKKVIAEMLYDTITKYENRKCDSCKFLDYENEASFIQYCKYEAKNEN